MEFTAWVRQWLSRHPLKELPAVDRAQYVGEVMERVKALGRPAPARRPAVPWSLWPRLALATASAAVAVLLVGRAQQTGPSLAEQVVEEARVLAALDEPFGLSPAVAGEVEDLAHELEALDALLLAEAPRSDDAWIEQTLRLLEQLGEEPSEDAAGGASGEEWLDELQWLDEQELSASS